MILWVLPRLATELGILTWGYVRGVMSGHRFCTRPQDAYIARIGIWEKQEGVWRLPQLNSIIAKIPDAQCEVSGQSVFSSIEDSWQSSVERFIEVVSWTA